jgi:hypothetical protein
VRTPQHYESESAWSCKVLRIYPESCTEEASSLQEN